MVGQRIGGVNVFGGGLPLYNARKQLVGAIGVSGDTSCADHNIAWRTRARLGARLRPGRRQRARRRQHQLSGHRRGAEPASRFLAPICKKAGVDEVSSISAGLPPTRK
jgi:hypothetical protein